MSDAAPAAGRIVHFIGFWPDYERFTFATSPPGGREWRTVDLREVIDPRGLFRKQRRRFLLRLYGIALRHALLQQPRAVFLFQDNGDLLELLHDVKTPFFGGVLTRNPTKCDARRFELLRSLQRKGMRIWSFDPDDCARYGFEYYPQFLHKAADGDDGAAKPVDLFFCGRDKGRAAVLEMIGRNAESAGCTADIEVLGERSKPVPYRDYLARLKRARCIVDINQDGQAGLTLRPIEAIFYRKKLITNNRSVADMPTYRPQNVMMIEQVPTPGQIAEFVRDPASPLPAGELLRYEAATVIERIVDQALQRPSLAA